jgi:hypothetical protein
MILLVIMFKWLIVCRFKFFKDSKIIKVLKSFKSSLFLLVKVKSYGQFKKFYFFFNEN